jgi:hypothetical protein
MIYVIILVQLFNLMLIINTLIVSWAQTRCNIQRLICKVVQWMSCFQMPSICIFHCYSNVLREISHTKTYDIILEREITFNFLKLDCYFSISVKFNSIYLCYTKCYIVNTQSCTAKSTVITYFITSHTCTCIR